MGAAIPFFIAAGSAGMSIYQANEQGKAYEEQAQQAYENALYNASAVLQMGDYNASMARTQAGMNAGIIEQQAIYDNIISRNNAKLSAQNAARARTQSRYDASRIRDRNKRLEGEQRAAVGKSGAEISGSAQDVMLDSAIQGELDALVTEYIGVVEEQQELHSEHMYKYQGQTLLTMGMRKADIVRMVGNMEAEGIKLEAGQRAESYRLGGLSSLSYGSAMSSQAGWSMAASAFSGGSQIYQMWSTGRGPSLP